MGPRRRTVALAAAGSGATVLAGCLRNATAVARAALRLGRTLAVVAAGERWPDGSLRPAVEDLLGAGAVLAALDHPAPSPEARAAAGAFRSADLPTALRECASGRELAGAGYANDVAVAARLDASDVVPVLSDRAFVALDSG